jgi:hypothetical protein
MDSATCCGPASLIFVKPIINFRILQKSHKWLEEAFEGAKTTVMLHLLTIRMADASY